MALAVIFVAMFGAFLASFPAHNGDLWRHLAAGRELSGGAVATATPTWLYDLLTYRTYRTVGGSGLVGVKALAVAGLAVVLLLAARTGRGWWLPVVCVALAVLAMGTRLLLQPATASCLFLALTVWLLKGDEADRPAGVWPGWRLVLLFVVWANVDRWFLFGLGTVALTWVGRSLDGRGPGLANRLGAVAVLAAVCLPSPAHVRAFAPLGEIGPAVRSLVAPTDAVQPPTSPFDQAYWSAFRQTPAGLAFYPLLGLGLVSFVAARRSRRWARFLPWAGLAAVAAVQARAVPFFAVVAGPVLAWNLQDFFADRGAGRPSRGGRVAAGLLGGLAAAAFLLAAWPGWLQRPPYEPRRWAVEEPVGLRQAAEFVRDGGWPAGTKTLHLTSEVGGSDTADAFAWFAPDDPRVVDDALAEHLLTADDASDRLRAAGVGRVAIAGGDRGLPERLLDRLLADPVEWPLVSLRGGVAVFAFAGPAAGGPADEYRRRAVDFDRLAFRPADAERAPEGRAGRPAGRKWWDAFRTPAPPRTGDRDEAAVLLAAAEVRRRSAPERKLREWEEAQLGGLVGAAGGWGVGFAPADAALRLAVFQPPLPAAPAAPLPPFTRAVFALQQPFVLDRDDAPPGVLYAAVRAARRAVSANPADAVAYLHLGRAYLALLGQTRERVWAARLPQLARLRQVQAVAAFARAAALNPNLAPAHLDLSLLYQQLGCLDLAADHLRTYRRLATRAGRLDPDRREVLDRELARLTEAVDGQTTEWEAESARTSVAQRAEAAAQRGLGGKARDILLESDVSAFGPPGMELQLGLLLRTGRLDDVIDWTAPEVRGALGPLAYHWLRSQALAGAGEYAAADAELGELAEVEGGVPDPAVVADRVGRAVGRALADELPGGAGVPHVAWRALARSDFQSRVSQISRALGHQADSLTLRGLVALEAGDVGRARAAFRAALAFSPGRAGGLDFAARPIARDGLGWLEPGP